MSSMLDAMRVGESLSNFGWGGSYGNLRACRILADFTSVAVTENI
jgi:hypothetical protein